MLMRKLSVLFCFSFLAATCAAVVAPAGWATAAVSVASPVPSAEPQGDKPLYVCVVADVANLRRSPAASGEVPFRVARCQLLPLVSAGAEWTKVAWQGETLYVATRLVRPVTAAPVPEALFSGSFVSVKSDEGMLPARLTFRRDGAGFLTACVVRSYADKSLGVAESSYVGRLAEKDAPVVRLWDDPTWMEGLDTMADRVAAAQGESPEMWYELVYDASTGHFFLCDDEFAPAAR